MYRPAPANARPMRIDAGEQADDQDAVGPELGDDRDQHDGHRPVGPLTCRLLPPKIAARIPATPR